MIDPKTLEEKFRKILLNNPNSDDSLLKLMESEEFDLESKIKEYKLEVDKKPNDPMSVLNLAFSLFHNKDYKSSEKVYEHLLEIDPNSSNNYFMYGFTCLYSQNYEKSAQLLKKAIELDPKNDSNYYTLAFALTNLNNHNLAIKEMQKAIDLNASAINFSNLSDIYGRTGDLDKGILAARKAIEINPEYINGHISLGILLSLKGYSKEAVDELNIGLKEHEHDRDYLYRLSHAQFNAYDYEDSKITINKLLELNPNDCEGIFLLGSIYEQKLQYERAILLFEKIKGIEGHNITPLELHSVLSLAYKNVGRTKDAINEYEAINSLSQSSDTYSSLGRLYYEDNQIEKAIKSYQNSLRIEPNSQNDHYMLGCCYFKNKNAENFDNCTSELKCAITIDPNSDVGIQAQKTLDMFNKFISNYGQ